MGLWERWFVSMSEQINDPLNTQGVREDTGKRNQGQSKDLGYCSTQAANILFVFELITVTLQA